jgi:hypothetical protein
MHIFDETGNMGVRDFARVRRQLEGLLVLSVNHAESFGDKMFSIVVLCVIFEIFAFRKSTNGWLDWSPFNHHLSFCCIRGRLAQW